MRINIINVWRNWGRSLCLEAELDRHARQFEDGNSIVAARLQQWDRLEARFRAWLPRLVNAANRRHLLDQLVVDGSWEGQNGDFGRFISVRFGNHPILRNPNGRIVTEAGCCLHVCQDAQGFAWTLLLPFESERQRIEDGALPLAWCRQPNSLDEIDFDSWARKFLSYAQVTAVRGQPIARDKFAVWWLRRIKSIRSKPPSEVLMTFLNFVSTVSTLANV